MTAVRTRHSGGLGSAAASITFWNLISRILGFVRVIATAGALGIAALGDTYQRTNQVSNLLFELLAGGMLFSVLVPTFVEHLDDQDHQVTRLASAVATRTIVLMGAVAAVGLLFAEPLMTLLTAGVRSPGRQAQIDLGVFLLWFVLPQLVFYAAGAVAGALLQANRRFVAISVAPACSSVVVTATMVAFAFAHDTERGLALTQGEKLLLGGGTLLATVAMTLVPVVATARSGYPLRPAWSMPGSTMGHLMRRGSWALGHVGLNQVLVMATVVLAGQIDGGVIAYQTAFAFFLLPHALLAHPIFTALYPELSTAASRSTDLDRFARILARGLRTMAVLVLPAAGVMAATAAPALSLVQLGQLDAQGTRLVASTLAAYLAGLAGYSAFFLLTRASYALGDARRPTLVNLWVTLATIAGMVGATRFVDDAGLLVAFGLVTALAGTAGSAWLLRDVSVAAGRPVPVAGSIGRSLLAASVATAGAWSAVRAVGWATPVLGVVSVGAATIVGGVIYVAGLRVLRSDELAPLARATLGRLPKGRR